ncbi:hypothetical protein C8N25_10928 [Algoriphagus antarcticus]|uniref:Uncharacterized protein n=1 Tax=Algoriphagus antarcticus TaxID=238540 RepID=A0A3E0DWP6_9BACT|nr:hypothetical protein C8N25_10928 [Algoriphagus antarcticus]
MIAFQNLPSIFDLQLRMNSLQRNYKFQKIEKRRYNLRLVEQPRRGGTFGIRIANP